MGKKIVIIGGGFAGMNAAKVLANQPEAEVTLIDKKNYHLFQPLLYQVATAGLNPSDIAVPIRAQFSKSANIEVRWLQAQKIDPVRQRILAAGTELEFDYLILACGATHSYFGHPEWEEFAPGLKTLAQGTEIRRRILTAYELAENESDAEKRAELLTFVIVGGGPTGVELAGAIADISRTVLNRDFKRIRPASTKIILIEAGERILASFSPELSKKSAKALESLGVELKTSSRVTDLDKVGVHLNQETIRTRNVIWAAGVEAQKIEFTVPLAMDKHGRLPVNADFSLPDYPNIFVAGDMATYSLPDKKTLPGLAPVAIQAGQYSAHAILSSIRGQPRKKFHYTDKGQMATIGKDKAIAQFKGIEISGRVAWFAWLFVHIFYLIGFKNRIFVLVQWAWSYIFSKRGARLITERDWRGGDNSLFRR